MLDFTLVKNLLLGDEWGLPPEANPVLFALDDGERHSELAPGIRTIG
jgi:hypothetical protein